MYGFEGCVILLPDIFCNCFFGVRLLAPRQCRDGLKIFASESNTVVSDQVAAV